MSNDRSRLKRIRPGLLILTPIFMVLATQCGRVAGSEATRTELQPIPSVSGEPVPIEVRVTRQDAEGATLDQIDADFAAALGSYLAARINENSTQTVEAISSVVGSGDLVFAMVRLESGGELEMLQLATIMDRDLVRVTCARSGAPVLSIETPDCASQIQTTFQVDAKNLTQDVDRQSQDPSLDLVAPTQPSVFASHKFSGGFSVDIPENWEILGPRQADDLNVYSEVVTNSIGLPSGQGNNKILVAANALNDAGQTIATVRLSVRAYAELTQSEMRIGMKEERASLRNLMLAQSEQTAKSLRSADGVKYYKVRDADTVGNDHLTCMWSSFEYDIGKGATVSDSWICPLGDRTLKLSTSYNKSAARLYAPIIEHIWRSLRTNG